MESTSRDNPYALTVDLHVARVVAVVSGTLNVCCHVVALAYRGGRITLVAINDLGAIVILHPKSLPVRIILDVDLLIVWIDSADGPVELSRLILGLLTASQDVTEDVAQTPVAGADREKCAAYGEDS